MANPCINFTGYAARKSRKRDALADERERLVKENRELRAELQEQRAALVTPEGYRGQVEDAVADELERLRAELARLRLLNSDLRDMHTCRCGIAYPACSMTDIDGEWWCVACLASELTRLASALPKTADGVTVVPMSDTFFAWIGEPGDSGLFDDVRGRHESDDGPALGEWLVRDDGTNGEPEDSFTYAEVENGYSTEAAARAAKENLDG